MYLEVLLEDNVQTWSNFWQQTIKQTTGGKATNSH